MTAPSRAGAEPTMHESEALLRIAIQGGRMGTWRWNLADRLIRGDAQFLAFWGFAPSDDLLPLAQFTERMSPDGAAEMEAIVTAAIAAGDEFDGEIEIVGGPTAGRWIRWRGRAAADDAVVLYGVTFDITEQKQAEAALRESEKRQKFLLKLSDALAPLTDAVEIMAAASRLTGEYLQLDRCGYGEVDPTFGHLVFPGWYEASGVPPFPGQISLEAFSPAYTAVIREGNILVADDIQSDPRIAGTAGAGNFVAARVAACVAVPLMKEGRLIGILSAHQAQPRAWTPAEVALLKDVLDRTAGALERARVEAALRASEEKYRTLFDSIDEGFALVEVILDADGKPADLLHLEVNAAYEQHTGLHDIVGKRALEVVPEGGPWLDFYGTVALTGQAARNESYLAGPIERWIAAYATRVGGEGSRKVAIVFNDITERKRAEAVLRDSEERQAFLLRLSDTLRPLSDAADIQQAAVALLGEHLAVNRAGYYEVGPDQNVFFLTAAWERGLPPLPDRMRITDFGDDIRAGYLAGRTMVMRDTEQEAVTEENLATVRAVEVRAWIGVPLVKDGCWVAATGVHSAEPRDWTPAEIRLVEDVAERTWAAAERARAEAALNVFEQNYRILFETMGQGYALVELVRDASGAAVDQRYIKFNPAIERLLGVSVAAATGRLASEVFPSIEPWWTETFDRVVRNQAPARVEHFFAPLGRWFEVYAYPAGGDRFVTLYEDITERRRAEEALRESEERQAFLLRLSDALQSLTDPLEIQRAATRLLGKQLGASRVFYVMVDHDEDSAVIHHDYVDGVPSRTGRYSLSAFSSAAVKDWRAGHVASSDDVDADPRYSQAERDAYASVSTRAGFGVPLRKEGRLAALLGVNQSTPRQWSDREIGLARAVAERTWDAVERARAEAAVAESEERLALAVDIGAIGHWAFDLATGDLTTSPICRRNFGRPEEAPFSYDELVASIHPDDRDRQANAVTAAAEQRAPLQIEYRLVTPSGETRWVEVRGRFVDGATQRLIGVSLDTTERKRAEERQQVLLAELQHRVRNILTVVRSVFTRTVEAGGDVEDITDHFRGRLGSLARTQVVVTQSTTGLVDLENLIRDELLSVGASDGPGLTIEGPDVALRAKEAESLGLAIHELTTNALKYGALKVAGAQLAVRWSVDLSYGGERRLDLTWTEQGVPAVPVRPSRYGFGSELIEEALPYRLGAETKLEFRGGGVSCAISVPLPDAGALTADPWKEP